MGKVLLELENFKANKTRCCTINSALTISRLSRVESLTMKKIALVFFANYSKSWVDSGNLAQLSTESELSVYANHELIEQIERLGLNLKTFVIPELETSRITKIFQLVSLINRRKISPSFNFRLKRLVFGELRLFPKGATPQVVVQSFLYNLRRFINFVINHPIETISFFPLIGIKLESLLRKEFSRISARKFISFESLEHFDLVLMPSAAIEDQIYEFIEFLKQSSTRSAICIENWDNLTSKSILISQPDFVFVMGNFCKSHGARIQSLQESQIIVAGLPRFNPYRNILNNYSQRSRSQLFRILYLGFSVPHNEKNLIGQLIALMEQSAMKGKYEFVYKPHPVRQPRFFESPTIPQNVRIIEKNPNLSGFSAIPAIDDNHFQEILKSDLVISTPTSMTIETMLLGVPTIIDATDDGIHRTTSKESLSAYLHLRDLRNIDDLVFGETAEDLFKEILDHYLGVSPSIRPSIENLIESRNPSYASHVINLVNSM